MKGVVVTTQNEMYVKEFAPPLYQSIGEVVGGWIEIVRPRGLKHRLVAVMVKPANRECANCGRFREGDGCGAFVDNCMTDYDAYSNWIPKGGY